MTEEYPKHPDDITPEWLTYALRQAGLLTHSHVKNIRKEILAKGKAWLSTIVKIEVEYDSPDENAPTSFVTKLLSESRMFRESSYELKAFEREINFYKEVAVNIPIRLPKLFYSVNGYHCNLMLMEDLSYLTPGDQVKGMDQNQVLLALGSLAKVHATYWDNPLLDSLEWIPTTNNIEEDYNENWDSFVELCGYFIDPKGLKVGEKIGPYISWISQEISKRPKTITHDDMKEDNLLFGEPGSDEAVVILDWQFVIRSMGATDVARLIGGSELPSERRGHQFEALRHWYEKLLENGVEDYSWDEAVRDFKLGALSCLSFPVHFHKGIQRSEGRALEYIKAIYSRLFLSVVEIDAESVLP